MNFTKLMPPSPNKIVSSFTTVLPNSNLHLMKKPFHASFFKVKTQHSHLFLNAAYRIQLTFLSWK